MLHEPSEVHTAFRANLSLHLVSRFVLVLSEMLCSPRLAHKVQVMQAASYTLNELFHSALPSEYDVYVPSTRCTKCVLMN